MSISSEPRLTILLFAVAGTFWCAGAARAEDASTWREIETKYIFGFSTLSR